MNDANETLNPGLGPRPAWTQRPIVLVGMMGAGKTSVGQRLAAWLQMPFNDADAEIERRAGMNITEIFALRGEAAFRADERHVILQLLQQCPGVLATGGGAYVNADIRDAIRSTGISVWLRCQLSTLLKRTESDVDRPLLQNKSLHQVLGSLIVERRRFYMQADIIIDNDADTIDQTVHSLLQALKQQRLLSEAEAMKPSAT